MPAPPPARHPSPPACGQPAVFQGRYGSRGNLELFVPSPLGGLTCCWFNSDPVEGPVTEPAIPAGTWSAGTALGVGTAYGAVAGVQASNEQGFLEVVASGDHGLDRWTWSPENGFVQTDTFAGATGLPFLADTVGGLVVGVAGDGGIRRWTARSGAYPRVEDWHEERLDLADPAVAAAAAPDGTVHALTCRGGRLRLHAWTAAGTHTTVTTPLGGTGAAAVSVDGGPVVVVTVADGELRRWLPGELTDARMPAEGDGGTDAVCCGWSTMGAERHLEVVTRSGAVLHHQRWHAGRVRRP